MFTTSLFELNIILNRRNNEERFLLTILDKYLNFVDMFLKAASDTLLPYRYYDYKI